MMTEQEAQALISIMNRLVRAGQISTVEAGFIQALITRLTAPPPPPNGVEHPAEAAHRE